MSFTARPTPRVRHILQKRRKKTAAEVRAALHHHPHGGTLEGITHHLYGENATKREQNHTRATLYALAKHGLTDYRNGLWIATHP